MGTAVSKKVLLPEKPVWCWKIQKQRRLFILILSFKKQLSRVLKQDCSTWTAVSKKVFAAREACLVLEDTETEEIVHLNFKL